MSRYESWSGGSSRAYAPYPTDRRNGNQRPQGRRSDGHQRNDHYRGRRSGGGHGNGGGEQDLEAQKVNNYAQKLKTTLFRLGDKDGFHAPSELYSIAQDLVDQSAASPESTKIITSTFRIMITEQPHKLPLTAALLATLILAAPTPKEQTAESSTSPALGSTILADVLHAFRSYLDARLWRNVRLTLRFFCLLAPLRIVTTASLFRLFESFTAVLSEPAVAIARADRAAQCVLEPLCFAAHELIGVDAQAHEKLDLLVDSIVQYGSTRRVSDDLLAPWSKEANLQNLSLESFETHLAAVQALKEARYPKMIFVPTPADLVPPAISADLSSSSKSNDALDLPETLVPPDEEEEQVMLGRDMALAKLNQPAAPAPLGATGRARAKIVNADEAQLKRTGTGPQGRFIYGRWMPDTTPAVNSPASVALRSLVNDIIDLYEPNRRDAAKLLVDLPKWLHKGTFAKVDPSIGIVGDSALDWTTASPAISQAAGSWILDDLLVESILSTAFLLPEAPYHELYYASLLREIVTLQPQGVAPAIGKTLRRLYAAIGTGRVEVELTKRTGDWFSVHLSNFNFGWAWKEWVPDMESSNDHPRRAFTKRVVDLCVRLAYYDRIKAVLPEGLRDGALPVDEPGPYFAYDSNSNPWHSKAAELVNSFRAKANPDVVMASLESFKREIVDPVDVTMADDTKPTVASDAQADVVVRDISTQALLHVGSRSFSHFLNIVERYHTLLRQLSTTPEMRVHILGGVSRFWSRSPQWVLIVVEKLLQYRIVEPTDVVTFVFDPSASVLPDAPKLPESRDWSLSLWWELLRGTIEKINGRVNQLQARVEALENEQTERQERADAEASAPAPESSALKAASPLVFPTTAAEPMQKIDPEKSRKETLDERRQALEAVRTEQRKVLAAILQGFSSELPKGFRADSSVDPAEDWPTYWLSGWMKEFLRRFHVQIAQNQETILTVAGARLPDQVRSWIELATIIGNE